MTHHIHTLHSFYQTCSHGSACNFIHCFRNPGGDYEWADWDNPPPKYWIRKMIALFGPSNEYEHHKQVDLKEFDRPRCSDRKRTPIDKRYVLLFLFWLQREYSLEVLCYLSIAAHTFTMNLVNRYYIQDMVMTELVHAIIILFYFFFWFGGVGGGVMNTHGLWVAYLYPLPYLRKLVAG